MARVRALAMMMILGPGIASRRQSIAVAGQFRIGSIRIAVAASLQGVYPKP